MSLRADSGHVALRVNCGNCISAGSINHSLLQHHLDGADKDKWRSWLQECKQKSDVAHTASTSPALATGSNPTNARSLNMSCFVNETKQTTLLPAEGLRNVNLTKARQAEKVAKSAQGKRSLAGRSGPCTLTEVEELIGSLVCAIPDNGYLPLLPHTDIALYHRVGTSKRHVDMYNESAVMATDPAGPAAVNE
eukprot:19481-Heterococcus_DN1.PRE.2